MLKFATAIHFLQIGHHFGLGFVSLQQPQG